MHAKKQNEDEFISGMRSGVHGQAVRSRKAAVTPACTERPSRVRLMHGASRSARHLNAFARRGCAAFFGATPCSAAALPPRWRLIIYNHCERFVDCGWSLHARWSWIHSEGPSLCTERSSPVANL